MPEITSVENIRAKLREFDEHVDGAITAATALGRIKADAEKHLAEIERMTARSEQSLQKAESVRTQFQQLQRHWVELKDQVDSAIQSLGKKVAEAEERLTTTNKSSLAEQAELLNRLDGSTRTNAEAVASAKVLVLERAERLNQLLGTIRDELQSETRKKLLDAEELLDLQLKEIEQKIQDKLQSTTQTLTETAASNEQVLREQMDSFKQEMKRSLSEHQQTIDRQLTDFLNKQNALVQNLSQQIDSYNRASQAQAAELAANNARLNELASGFNMHKTTVTSELPALAAGIGELKGLLAKVQAGLASQGQANAALGSSLQTTAARLDETLNKLKQLPLVGSKFK